MQDFYKILYKFLAFFYYTHYICPMTRKERAKKYREEALNNLTSHEVYFRRYLKNIYYTEQKNFFYGDWIFYRVDFYIPSLKLVIELDGRQHKDNKKYDNKRTRTLKKLGVKKVLRFNNEEIFNTDKVEQLLKLIIHELTPKKTKRQKK